MADKSRGLLPPRTGSHHSWSVAENWPFPLATSEMAESRHKYDVLQGQNGDRADVNLYRLADNVRTTARCGGERLTGSGFIAQGTPRLHRRPDQLDYSDVYNGGRGGSRLWPRRPSRDRWFRSVGSSEPRNCDRLSGIVSS